MSYSTVIIREQGGSVLRLDSTASLVTSSGAKVNLNDGTLDLGAGTVTQASGGAFNVSGSLTVVESAGAFFVGNAQILYGDTTNPPTVSASPGSLFLRTDGSASNMYLNTSDGTGGSVWAAASINRP